MHNVLYSGLFLWLENYLLFPLLLRDFKWNFICGTIGDNILWFPIMIKSCTQIIHPLPSSSASQAHHRKVFFKPHSFSIWKDVRQSLSLSFSWRSSLSTFSSLVRYATLCFIIINFTWKQLIIVLSLFYNNFFIVFFHCFKAESLLNVDKFSASGKSKRKKNLKRTEKTNANRIVNLCSCLLLLFCSMLVKKLLLSCVFNWFNVDETLNERENISHQEGKTNTQKNKLNENELYNY